MIDPRLTAAIGPRYQWRPNDVAAHHQLARALYLAYRDGSLSQAEYVALYWCLLRQWRGWRCN